MVLNVAPGGKSLADIRKIAEDTAEARLLAQFKLSGNILVGGGLGCLPLYLSTETNA